MCTKVNRTLGFLRRDLFSCPQGVKEAAYKSLARPILEYGSSVWDPHCNGLNGELKNVFRWTEMKLHIQFDYTLHQQRLEQVRSTKYLGITISDDLDWGQHISEISSKATKTLGFLRRTLVFAPRHTKEVAYKTLVRPKLEYAAPIWHPYHETQIGQVEKVQRTAARRTCRRWRNTSSVGDMLDELEWPSLETRRGSLP